MPLNLPFHAWECITLLTKRRAIDLVIPDEDEMRAFVEFLIIRLNTFNGVQNSINILKNKKIIERHTTVKEMLPHIYKSYFWMRIRMKISFEACRVNRTIQEHMLITILKTYKQRCDK